MYLFSLRQRICVFFLLNSSTKFETMANVMSDNDYRTFRDFLLQYNMLTESCFKSCVKDFSSQTLGTKEEKCSKNCMDKFLKSGQRLTLRFQEHQLLNMEAQGVPIAATKAGANVLASAGT